MHALVKHMAPSDDGQPAIYRITPFTDIVTITEDPIGHSRNLVITTRAHPPTLFLDVISITLWP